jgi:transposase-like protein
VSTRSRRKFTPDFKAEAVEMVEAAGGNIAQVAKELGIYDSTLGNWVRQAREQAAGAPTASNASSHAPTQAPNPDSKAPATGSSSSSTRPASKAGSVRSNDSTTYSLRSTTNSRRSNGPSAA